tara:strand:- start:34 stop:1116 length:1083 start_codon:yes stop_codon:yes gene_type:complete
MKRVSNYFKRKKILITGHTGFKGSWLSLCLYDMGAKILGISNGIPTEPSHFKASLLKNKIKSKNFDISNKKKLEKTIFKFKPDYIFHLAAQSLVQKSYSNPLETWRTNLIGTVNLLDSLKNYNRKITVILITSDKSYKNVEKKEGYKETDVLFGVDPYSASKSSADIAIQSYFNSYFKNKKNILIAVARAGNVVGGGDWSKDRLIPDCIRAWSKGKSVQIRNPNSTRPWQHVLEAVWGYIILAVRLNTDKKVNGEAFNFGPNTKKNYKVIECLKVIKKYWPTVKWKIKYGNLKKHKESGLLKLNSNKAKRKLKWNTVLSLEETMKMTAIWYRNYYKKNSISHKQIRNFKTILMKKLNLKI